ncbi:hypothetical protein [Streptomyces reniochalinae]|uniref:hypothetical protein n=1 Tax=Streptomyces reniochalinae TaxID=2250578 RepID=UPI001FEC7B87|nr:hypothetical protein [Streptomyces reniochalinae]
MRTPLRLLDVRPLRGSRPFRALWIGSSASQLGGQVATVAVLAQVWDVTGTPVGTGAIGLATATSAPFSLVAGGLSAGLAIALVATANTALRAYRTPAPAPPACEPDASGTAGAATAAG